MTNIPASPIPERADPQRAPKRPSALGAAGVFWFVVMLIGQWAFFAYIAGFYGRSVAAGDLEMWNRLAAIGRTPYVAGDAPGNLAYATHALAAGIIAFGGALQLMPWIRARAPALHRWNGRLFLVTVVGLSLSGFYLVWVRGRGVGLTSDISITLNGVLILTFAALAYRMARARKLAAHRRWAMRLYLVSNAQWFLRIGMFGYFVFTKIIGYEASFDDPFPNFWIFGCYLVPLGVLELYLRAQDGAGPWGRRVVAGLLVALTLAMTVGIFAFSMFTYAIVVGAPLGLPG